MSGYEHHEPLIFTASNPDVAREMHAKHSARNNRTFIVITLMLVAVSSLLAVFVFDKPNFHDKNNFERAIQVKNEREAKQISLSEYVSDVQLGDR